MKKSWLLLVLISLGVGGCETFHEDYSVQLISEPQEAEVWKGSFFLGYTPHLLTITATEEEDEAGVLVFPALTLKKEGYLNKPLKLELKTGEGHYWECLVELEKKKNDRD